MIDEMVCCTSLIGDFIKETGYCMKPKNSPIEVGDVFDQDRKTGKLINYGNINDIMNLKEFKLWCKKKEEELNNG